MKGNRKAKTIRNNDGYMQIVAGIIALLLTIVIGVMVYFEVDDGIDQFDEVVETFGTYADTTNASAWSVTLDNSPASTSDVNVTCVNLTAGAESYPTFSLSHKTISVAADAANNFTQVNVTYTSHMSSDAGENTDMAGTVFGLLPIIALVVIAAIILAVVLGFGGNKGGL